MQNDTRDTGTEIRVHGIGDHDLLSALGSPRTITPASARAPALVEPPAPVDHRLLLVNWSRVSRSAPAFLWYIAFPFTLLNLARAMHPVDSVQRQVHVWAVRIVSAVISATTAVWIFAIVETLFRWVRLPVAIEGGRSYITALVASMSLCIPMLYRAGRPESDGHRAAALVHVLIVSAVTLSAVLVKPAQVEIDLNSRFSVFAVEGPTDSQHDQMLKAFSDPSISKVSVYDFPQWLDVVAVASYNSLLAIGLLAVVLFVVAPATQNTRAAATGLALIVSAALLNLFASSIFIASKRLASSAAASGWVFFIRKASYHPSEAMVSGRFGESFATSISAGVAATILLAMFVVTLCVVRPRPLHWRRTSKPRLDFGLWAHKVVASLSQNLVLILVITVIPLLVLELAVITLLERYIDASEVSIVNGVEQRAWPHMYYWMSYIVSLLGLVVFFSIRNAHRLQPVRRTLALIADIAGFWPISVHPLGARTYRSDVVRGVLDAIRKTQAGGVVLVGHSQGSVIAAWALGGEGEGQVPPSQDTGTIKPSLITCGSPLASLYQTLFPGHFDRDFFLRVRLGTSRWANFWRKTDPIATEIDLPGVEIENSELDDPPSKSGDALGHSDYWVAPDQLEKVAEFLQPQVARPAT